MTPDHKATAAQVLRLVSASIGLASAPMKTGPYSWIGTLAQASTTAAADILAAPDIATADGKRAIGFALASVFDALPEVTQAQAEDLAAGVVAAVRVIRKWST